MERRLWGLPQTALSSGDYAGAATLLTGAQSYAATRPGSYKETGRGLLAQAYSRIGGVGMTIDKESPLAPLMEILLQLRLGDNERALEAYLERQKLFDKHRDEMPLELILFAAESHVPAGGDENHQRVEDLLAVWLVKNDESKNFSDKEKASVRLLLARNYFKWLRFDAARSEYTTVKNSYPDSEDAVEAEFGIGESFMAQKNYSKAEEIFEDLANSRDSKVIIRAEFMRGLLASNQGDRDRARDIFRSVLERVPDVKLANETLYNLAEVYGVEQRFMDQLQLLRAVGLWAKPPSVGTNPELLSPLSFKTATWESVGAYQHPGEHSHSAGRRCRTSQLDQWRRGGQGLVHGRGADGPGCRIQGRPRSSAQGWRRHHG